MDAKTKEEIELLQELIDSPDTPQDEKELYRDTIKELKAEAEKAEKKPETKKEEKTSSFKKNYKFPVGQVVWDKTNKVYGVVLNNYGNLTDGGRGELRLDSDGVQSIFSYNKQNYVIGYNLAPYGSKDDTGNKDLSASKKSAQNILGMSNSKEDKEYYEAAYKDLLAGKFDKKPATPKPSATKKEAPKKLPVDADKMKAEIKERTGKTEEECEVIIAEYRQLREKSKKIEAKRLGKLDDEGKLIAGTKEKTAAAVIETAAENIKDKLEKQVDKLEKEAEKGDRTPEQIEARINKNLGQLSKEMTKQATSFIKGIQAELGKADKTEAKQFLMNVRAEIDDLLSKFGGGGWLRDRRQVNQSEDYETRYEKKNNTGRTSYAKKKNSVGSTFGGGGGVDLNSEIILTENRDGGSVVRAVVFPFMLESIEDNQYKGGFKRYEIDIYDEVEREPTKKEIEELNSFFDKVGGRFDVGGFVQTYNITQGNMSSSSVNPSQFGEGGGVDGKEIIDLGNGFTIEVNKVFYESGDYTYGALLNYNGELFKYFVIMPNETKEGAVKNIYNYLGSLEIKGSERKVKEGFPRKGEYLVIFSDRGNSEIKRVFDALEKANKFVKDIETISSIKFNKDNLVFGEGGDIPPYEGERFSQEEFNYRLNLAKHQIISDIMDGTVDPSKVNDFGDLGAFVDHNYYGGFIEDDYDHSEGFVFEMSVQDALNEWIEEGGINKALENPEMFAVGGSVDDQISYADSRINNLKELRSVSNEDMRENIDFQIESIEKEKSRLLSGELVPRKKLFGLF